MKLFAAVTGVCVLLAASVAQAEAPGDPLSWLGRIASAGERVNFTGTFMYQSGTHSETSRIAHRVDADGAVERLEVLDGSPREVIRRGNEVRCVLPEEKTVIIDETGVRRAFPVRLPASYGMLAESYRVRKGELNRVAGYEAQAIVLEPRDNLRYGRTLWAERQSGLLLKSRIVDESGGIVEQITFNDVRIGGEIGSELLAPRFEYNDSWRVVNARGDAMPHDDTGWTLSAPLPGYVLDSAMKRPLGREGGEAIHLVFSDGVAAISVFIEPLDGQMPADLGLTTNGAINIFKRAAHGYLITALGEVPARAVRQLGEAIVPAVR
jgi:sigma-E factor negative regulatory protein RseB